MRLRAKTVLPAPMKTMTPDHVEALKALGGGIDVKYGDVFRLRYGKVDLPANGGPDLLGTFRVLTFAQDKDLRFRPVHGDSYIAVVEFSDRQE